MTEVFKQADLARILKLGVRTLQRRRLLDSVYEPDYIDRTGHPVWEAPTVQRILEKEKGAK